MELLHIFDAKDYDEGAPRTVREAVRAIIPRDGLLAMVRSDKYGDYKFPGGGAMRGESHAETLIRETREETGLTVVPASIRPYGMTREIHRNGRGGGVFEQISYYYVCRTEGAVSSTNLDDYERAYGYRLVFVPIAEAIATNERLQSEGMLPWTVREGFVLRHLRDNPGI